MNDLTIKVKSVTLISNATSTHKSRKSETRIRYVNEF